MAGVRISTARSPLTVMVHTIALKNKNGSAVGRYFRFVLSSCSVYRIDSRIDIDGGPCD